MDPPVLPILPSGSPLFFHIKPLTPSSFSPFGTAIVPFLPPTLNIPPTSASEIPSLLKSDLGNQAGLANQGSAVKFSDISVYGDQYVDAPSAIEKGGRKRSKGRPAMSMFSCFPRKDLPTRQLDSDSGGPHVSAGGTTTRKKQVTTFPVKILERHPYTTQTFIPLDTGTATSKSISRSQIPTNSPHYLIIVAPSLPTPLPAHTSQDPKSPQVQIRNPPDLSSIHAFIATTGTAVTYGIGTWHAPMVVLGDERVDFVVTQWVSGVAEEDCQEVLVGKADEDMGGVEVVVGEVDEDGHATIGIRARL